MDNKTVHYLMIKINFRKHTLKMIFNKVFYVIKEDKMKKIRRDEVI